MAGSTSVFILLSIFYYEYVDPSEFDDEPKELDEKIEEKTGEKNDAFAVEEKNGDEVADF